jgi:hypothetical protein
MTGQLECIARALGVPSAFKFLQITADPYKKIKEKYLFSYHSMKINPVFIDFFLAKIGIHFSLLFFDNIIVRLLVKFCVQIEFR